MSSGPTDCPCAAALEVVGERWSLLAVREMVYGGHRFEEIARRTGAPRNILTTRLRHLEQHGVLERRQYQAAPARYEYHLTAAGQELLPVVLMLMEWGNKHLVDEPKVMDHSCGAPLHAVTICAGCGEPARLEDATAGFRSAG